MPDWGEGGGGRTEEISSEASKQGSIHQQHWQATTAAAVFAVTKTHYVGQARDSRTHVAQKHYTALSKPQSIYMQHLYVCTICTYIWYLYTCACMYGIKYTVCRCT